MSTNVLFAQVEMPIIFPSLKNRPSWLLRAILKSYFGLFPKLKKTTLAFYLIRVLVKDRRSVPQKLGSRYIHSRFCPCFMGYLSDSTSDMIIFFKKSETSLGEWVSPIVRVPEIKPGRHAGQQVPAPA